MSGPEEHEPKPAPVNEHDQPTVIDVRSGPPPRLPDGSISLDEDVAPLSRIGEYELLREVGRGGMGVVFEARHVRLGRVVALKMIQGGALAGAEDLHRFDTEVAAAARLQHPGIVALYEVSTHEQRPYFSMEFIKGSSLAQRLAMGPIATRRAAGIIEAVARAVDHAHTKGIIHRDLKPANVLLDEHDQPKVTDFGLAKLTATDSGQTRTGAVLGTPSYMAPEQAAGRRDIGPACDIWSLGAILYELLTGLPPFRGETAMATLQQVADKDPVPPRLFDPNIDRDLETICLKCLEKEPTRRYHTAEALADDLRRYLDGEPIAARRHGVIARSLKWCLRRKALTGLLIVSAAAVIGLVTFEVMARNEEAALRKIAQVREQGMRHLLYLAEMRRAQQDLELADFDRVQRLIQHWDPRPDSADLRDWEWYFLKAHSEGRFSVRAHGYQANAVAWRPDGRQFASAGGEPSKPGEIKVWEADTGKLAATLAGHKQSVSSLAWHPTKALLASAGFDGAVKLWNLGSNKEVASLSGHRGAVRSVAFSIDGAQLASAGSDKSIRLWNVEQELTGKYSARVLTGHEGEVTAVGFGPRGAYLASVSADKTVRIWNTRTFAAERVLTGHEGKLECLAFDPSGMLLATGGGVGFQRGEVKLWNPQTGELLTTHYGLSDRVTALAMNSAGDLAAGGADGLVHVWDQARTSESINFRADKQILSLAFRPDGQAFAVAGTSGRVSLFNTSGSLESLRLAAPGPIEAIAFHPDGASLAAAGKQGFLRMWPLESHVKPTILPGHAADVTSVAFSPKGDRLASGTETGAILVHDMAAPQKEPLLLTGHGGLVRALLFAPDGSYLVSASDDDTVRIWDLATASPRRVLQHGNSVRALALSSTGRWLAAGGVDKLVSLWDMNTGAVTKFAGHAGTVNAVAFSPDDAQLISGSSDRTIRLWNVAQQSEERVLDNLSAPVMSLAYHPGGARFASLGQDKVIRLWDVVTRQEILELEDPAGPPRGLIFSNDGRRLAAVSGNTVRVWDSGRAFKEN